MFTKITSIGTLSGTNMTLVLIHIWDTKASHENGDLPSGDNAFVMDLVAVTQHFIEDSQGRYKTTDALYVHPDRATGNEVWEMDESKVNIAEEIRSNIRLYLARRKRRANKPDAYPAFHAKPVLLSDDSDPRGILAMSDVMDMVGKEVK